MTKTTTLKPSALLDQGAVAAGLGVKRRTVSDYRTRRRAGNAPDVGKASLVDPDIYMTANGPQAEPLVVERDAPMWRVSTIRRWAKDAGVDVDWPAVEAARAS